MALLSLNDVETMTFIFANGSKICKYQFQTFTVPMLIITPSLIHNDWISNQDDVLTVFVKTTFAMIISATVTY